MNAWRRTVRALALLGLALFSACGERAEQGRETIVLLFWEGVPREAFFDMPGGRVEAMPTLAGLEGLARHDNYYPSSDRSETRLTTILAEDGRFPRPAGLLDWGARRVPEGLLSSELRRAGYRRLATVSGAELACLDTQFDVLHAPAFDGNGSDRDFHVELERALESRGSLFLLMMDDVFSGRARPEPERLATHLRARLDPHITTVVGLANLLAGLQGTSSELKAGIEALREMLERRRGTPAWKALRRAESDARLAAADERLQSLLVRMGRHNRRAGSRLLLVGGLASDPQDAAFGAPGDGRAALYTLGFEKAGPRDSVQETDLREMFRAALTNDASVSITTAESPGPTNAQTEGPSITRIMTYAGRSRVSFLCRAGDGEFESEERWVVDALGVHPVGTETSTSSMTACAQAAHSIFSSTGPVVSNETEGFLSVTFRTPGGEGLGVNAFGSAAAQRIKQVKNETVLPGGTSVPRTTRSRPDLLITLEAADVVASLCSVGGVPLTASDLPVLAEASAEVWAEEEPPRLDLEADTRWQRVQVGHAGDGSAELIVEAWPPRLEADPAPWILIEAETRILPHPLRPGAWIVRGPAPLEVRLKRKPHGRFGYCARIGGERIGPEATRIDGFRAIHAGEVTILLSAGAWNDAALYGAAPAGHPLGLRLLGKPPAHEVTLPSMAEREFLLRTAARNQ